jgi:hypothetical protein
LFSSELTPAVLHPQESLPVASDDDLAAVMNDREARLFVDLEPVPTISKRHDVSGGNDDRTVASSRGRTMSNSFMEDSVPLSGPVQLTASTGFAWAKKPRPDAMAATKRTSSKCPRAKNNGEVDAAGATTASYQVEKQEMIKQWTQVAEAFSSSEAHNSRLRQKLDVKQLKTGKVHNSQIHIRVNAAYCLFAFQCSVMFLFCFILSLKFVCVA